MLEFTAGIVLGAIFGVVADRLWGRIERQPRLQLKIGFFTNVKNEKGLTYTVRNVGSAGIPDYQIGIFHPLRGTLYAFPSEQRGALLPDQHRKHQCLLVKNETPDGFIRSWILRERDTVLEDVEIKDFSLRVVMTDSENVLYESSRIGNAIAREWLRTVQTGGWGRSTWEENQAMCTPPPKGLKYWLERRRERKEIERVMQDAGGPQ
jgi:hypothetical protein